MDGVLQQSESPPRDHARGIRLNAQLSAARAPARTETVEPPDACPIADGVFSALPDDLVREVAGFLSVPDMRAAAQTEVRLRAVINPQLDVLFAQQALAAQAAANVQDLAGFLRLLKPNANTTHAPEAADAGPAISGLRADLQTQPLTELLARLEMLPRADWQAAARAFHATIGAMRLHHLSHALQTFDRISRHTGAQSALSAGENVQHIAAYFGITAPPVVAAMESDAVFEPGLAAMRAGENVHAVAERFGLRTEVALHDLERVAVSAGPARSAVAAGQNLLFIARAYGIETFVGIRALERVSIACVAGHAVRSGENVRLVAQAHGIVSQPGVRSLELIALYGHALRQVSEGANVRAVADRYGITTDESIEALESSAVANLELSRSPDWWRGRDPAAVAHQLGIRSPAHINNVMTLALQALPAARL